MRWLGLTVALLAASASLLSWVYLRDRDAVGWRAPESQLAHADAVIVLEGEDCHWRCAVAVQGRAGQPHRWLVRLTVRGRPQCLRIDVDTFTVTRQDGLTGVQPRRCTTL